MSCKLILGYRSGVNRPSLLMQLWSDKDNAPFPIAGKTIVFDMRNIMTDALKIEDGTVVVVDSENSIVRYDWADGDLTTGKYDPFFVVQKGEDDEQAFPKERNEIIIEVS